MATISTRE